MVCECMRVERVAAMVQGDVIWQWWKARLMSPHGGLTVEISAYDGQPRR